MVKKRPTLTVVKNVIDVKHVIDDVKHVNDATKHVDNSKRDRNIWKKESVQNNMKKEDNKYNKNTSNTLKEALKNRPPVSIFIKEITKSIEEDHEHPS